MAPELQSWRFNIRVPAADRLVERLFAEGLFASRHYASLGRSFGEGRFPVAERLHSEVVNLFNDQYFDEERAGAAVEVVLRHLAERLRVPRKVRPGMCRAFVMAICSRETTGSRSPSPP